MALKDRTILIFAAHQDDETIGCGASIRKWADVGNKVYVCFVTDGSTGKQQGKEFDDIVATRMTEAREAAKILGILGVSSLSLECQRVSNRKINFHKVIKVIREIKPDIVITHNKVCKHRDHKRVSEIVEEACWKAQEDILEELGEVHRIEDLWSFEILDPHPNPDIVVDVTKTYDSKIEAMNVYFSQHGILDGIYSYMDGLSKVRGYSIGAERGEAFTRIGRMPIKL